MVDGGLSWRPGGATSMLTTNECAIAELSDGTLVRTASRSPPGPAAMLFIAAMKSYLWPMLYFNLSVHNASRLRPPGGGGAPPSAVSPACPS